MLATELATKEQQLEQVEKSWKSYFTLQLLQQCKTNEEKKFETLSLISLMEKLISSKARFPLEAHDPNVWEQWKKFDEGLSLHWDVLYENKLLTLIVRSHEGVDMNSMSNTNRLLTYFTPEFLNALKEKNTEEKLLISVLQLLKYLVFHGITTVPYKTNVDFSISHIPYIQEFFSPVIEVSITKSPERGFRTFVFFEIA